MSCHLAMNVKYLFLVLSLCFVAICSALAQLPSIQFETITTRDGLPSGTVLSATKDRNGFMWFGTRLYPVRYDGATFLSLTSPETNLVSGICVDSSNNVWLSSDPNGIAKIETSSLQMELVLKDSKERETGFFYIDKHNRGWYSDFHGINRVDLKTQKQKHYPLKQSTYVWAKASFVEDSHGTLWVVGRDNGLFRYDSVRDTLVCEFGEDSPDPTRRKEVVFAKAYADAYGFLWFATVSDGLIKYNTRDGAYKIYGAGKDNQSMLSVAEGIDEYGKRILWIGHQDGLGIFRPEQEKFYYFDGIFSGSYEVNDIYRDPENGIVWACTSEGIIKYHPKSNSFQSVMLPSNLVGSSTSVNAVVQDNFNKKIFYLGLSHTGMLRWDRTTNTFTLIKYPQGGSADTRWMIQRDDGRIWIGTHRWDYNPPGLFVYDTKTQRFLETATSRMATEKFSIPFFRYGRFDQHGRLWTGNTDDGLSVFNEAQRKDETPWNADQQRKIFKDNSWVTDIIVTKNGDVVLGTKGGVLRTNTINNTLTDLDRNIPDTMAWRSVNSMLEDKEGNIWAARWGAITQVSLDGQIKNIFTSRSGFYDQECGGLAEDEAGNIWIGNYEGLYCINPATTRVIRFTVNDGLISNNTVGRVFMFNNGKDLIVGQKNGFNVVNVSNLLSPAKAPNLAISSFRVHDKSRSIDITKPVILKRDENSFSVDFIALNYRKQQDNVYAYYLEGFDNDWIHSGTHHVAYYTNLSPGKYTLHLKAGDSFGNWSKQIVNMHIVVVPAFYETWWFRVTVAVFAIGLLYALYRFRVNQLLRLQMMRNRISADLHDELGSSLSSIGIMGKLAQNTLAEEHPSAEFVDRIVEEAQQMSGSLDDIVWNISPKNDALSSMMARMTRYASEVFEAKKIIYKVTMPEDISEITLSMEQRRNVYLIFKESVNNVVKHSHCRHASVTVRLAEKNFELVVEDDGVGFDQRMQNDRNGLVNLRERAEKLNGTIEITSTPGMGSSVKLVFPLRVYHPKGLLNNR
jgi:ligand-binding sensor domain-containing protein/two-component sensor histidine kinase